MSDHQEDTKSRTPRRLTLLTLLLDGLGGRMRSLRPPYEIVMEVISRSVITNLEEIGIHDLRIEGVVLLEIAAAFLKKVGVDKAKAQELLGLLMDGEQVNKTEKATALAAELVVGHVESCPCAEHPIVVLDELPEQAAAPVAEEAPMAG